MTSTDLTGGATGEGVTTQAGGCTKVTQADPVMRLRLPWLSTDEETETKPEDFYSQGDRVDSCKDRWEKAVGGIVSETRRLIPPQGPLVRDPDCCEEEPNDRSRQSWYGESRPFRLGQPAGHAGGSLQSPVLCMEGRMSVVIQRMIAMVPETLGICNHRRADQRSM